MKKLICGLGLALGLSFSCHAQGMKVSAYPNTNNLAGTNLFLIAIPGSPGTNMNISYAQLSNLLAAAIGGGGGGAQVWTNDGTFIFVSGTEPSNSSSFFIRNDGSTFIGTNVNFNVNPVDLSVLTYPAIGLFAASNQPVSWLATWECTDNPNDYTFDTSLTMTGFADSTLPTAKIKLDAYPSTGSDDQFLVFLDPASGASGTQMKLLHDSKTIFLVDSNGLCSPKSGVFYASNAVPIVPTAAALGAGGYWTGNSNGFLVTIYSLDGSTTVMKVLAP